MLVVVAGMTLYMGVIMATPSGHEMHGGAAPKHDHSH